MKKQHQNLTKSMLILVLALFAFKSHAQTKNFIDKPYLETTATFTTKVEPDRLYLSILITEKDTRGKMPVEVLENRMAEKLRSLKIDVEKQLMLSDLASDFKKYALKKDDVLKNKAYVLVVYDAETAGKVIVALESINISNIQLHKAEYSKLETLKVELKGKAVAKAKTQAISMLKPLGQNLGKAIFISDQATDHYEIMQETGGVNTILSHKNKAEYSTLAIAFEKISVASTVTVYFEIE